ncbi:MAG: hypothetical protein HDS23_06395 [Bacteroides sp.]|nr:hypothetical protein [Bacteroides sp.]
MNKSVKILLLVVAVIIAIGGVLLFMKTIVSPPQDLEFKNQFEVALNQKIDVFKKVDSNNLEREFATLTDLAHRFKSESNIDDKLFDKEYTEIIGVYSPKFAQYCFGQFQKSVWDESEHKWMEERIAQLRKLTVEDGSRKIMDNYAESDGRFSIILKTIGKYREAKALSNRTGYSGLSEARSRINKANQYKQDDYLKNNATLMKALNSLPSHLEASHYASLRAKVNTLANYYSYSADSYDALSDNVVAALKEYKQNARSVYGESRSLSDLEADASRYYNAAVEYYKN